jgi:hypothetical protein
MPGKPYKSCLIPYEDEIVVMRRKRPPMPYEEIANQIRQKHGLAIQGPAIFKFLKARFRRRKVSQKNQEETLKKTIPVRPFAAPTNSTANPSQKPEFVFVYSERYNLKRLPPDEAAAIRKELEKEGH